MGGTICQRAGELWGAMHSKLELLPVRRVCGTGPPPRMPGVCVSCLPRAYRNAACAADV